MANIVKNRVYPYIQKYINEYLHGFSKEKIDIELTKGEITLEKMSLRPDTINKIMDEKNVPFWIKVGLISKIYVGASVLSVIGEIPIEIVIDGVNIILSPSYKWIIRNMENYTKNNSGTWDKPNPLGNDIFNKKVDDFDTSVFNIEKIQEIFKDKSALSIVINNLFKSLYSFYSLPNFVVVIKIKNLHIRFEDDELMNYTGDIACGLRVNLFQIKLGCKGNMKKDSIKLESLDIYWENEAKILISSNFLNDCIEEGKLNEKYFENLRKVHFERFQYLTSTKFILQDFNFSINLGTRCENKGEVDIFDVKNYPSMVYFQFASNELNINVFPELAKISNNFRRFTNQFPIIEKVKDYHPFIKPTEKNSMNYINIVENYRKNVLDKNNKKKMLVRDWINYFYWYQKSKNGEKIKVKNPIRSEFVRFYKICLQKVDIHEKKEKEKIENEGNKEQKEGILKYAEDEKRKNDESPDETPNPGEIETPLPDETPNGDNINKIKLIPEELNFSARIDLLIKGLNVNLHSPLNENVHNYISLSVNGIEIKIKLTKEKFDFDFKIKTIDLGPSNLIIGQRVIIQPKSYRKAISDKNYSSINTSNYYTIQNTRTDLNSRITNLIKKYNPNHEEKIKVIDEALELAGGKSRLVSLVPSENEELKFKSPIKNKTPFGDLVQNLGKSTNLNMSDLGKTYGNLIIPKNTTFAKNLIDNNNYEGSILQDKKYERKKINEMNISQAINDYNSYKNQERLKLKAEKNSSSLAKSQFNLKESIFGINPNNIKAKNSPLNLLEIFSNTEVGALSLNFTKYNNPITSDNFSIQLGTIRLNMFANYLLDILKILSDYKKATKTPKIKSSKGNFVPEGKKILEMQEYFYNYILKNISDIEKTESIIEYMEYLKREINSKKKYSPKPEYFVLNQIFSVFPKGFEFHFDYENIEIIAYDKDNVVSSKIIIPSGELVLNLNFTKIFVKLLELEIEIEDLNKCETIIEQLKELAKDKFKVAQIVLEPRFRQLKEGIEPLINDDEEEDKQIISEPKKNNLSQKKQEPILEKQREELFENQKLFESQYKLKKEDDEKEKREQEQLLIQTEQKDISFEKQNQIEKGLLIQNREEKEKEIEKEKEKEIEQKINPKNLQENNVEINLQKENQFFKKNQTFEQEKKEINNNKEQNIRQKGLSMDQQQFEQEKNLSLQKKKEEESLNKKQQIEQKQQNTTAQIQKNLIKKKLDKTQIQNHHLSSKNQNIKNSKKSLKKQKNVSFIVNHIIPNDSIKANNLNNTYNLYQNKGKINNTSKQNIIYSNNSISKGGNIKGNIKENIKSSNTYYKKNAPHLINNEK